MPQTARQQPQRRTPPVHYLLEVPSTELYAALTDKGYQLAKRRDATRFATRNDAVIAAAGQALEPVRFDA